MASSARIDELRKKFEENPRRYFAPLANEYRKVGQIDQAIAICREYLPQQPGHMSGHIVYGQALYEARQFDEAKTVFETALSLDPENLIALRHLGDIALIVGDAEAARGWYRRVLEADPRNEEIQAQLTRLDQGGAQVAGAPPAAAPASSASASPPAAAASPTPKPTPSSSPTVVMAAVRPPEPPRAPPTPVAPPAPKVTADSPTAEINLETLPHRAEPQDQLLDAVVEIPTTSAADFAIGGAPAGAPSAMASVPALELESPVAGASHSQDAPPIDGFSLDGLETTSLATPEPPAPPPSAPEPAAIDLDFGAAVAAQEPPAVSAAAPTSAPAPLADLDFGELATPSSATVPSPVAKTAPVVPSPITADAPVPELLDLGDPIPTAAPAPATPPPAEPVAALEELSLAEAPEEVAGAPESGPFVTETMAELYLQQGHKEEALRVYRALLEQRPNDVSLQVRVARLDAEMAPAAARPAPSAPAPAAKAAPAAPSPAPAPVSPAMSSPPGRARSGPTIREILSVVAMRRPGHRPEPPRQNGSMPADAGHAAPPSAHPLGPDAIGALFGGGQVNGADEAAALSLALAFSDMNGRETGGASAALSTIPGEPARRAANELSLDSVFGSSEAPRQDAPANFSFDQFFSQRAAAQSGGVTEAEPGVQSKEDVAQFTQWLEGLKQR